jgi:hypothetical protein
MPNSLGHLNPLFSDFTYGELCPQMLGRTDSDVYHKGAQTMKNFIPRLTGGFRKRPGTLMVGKTYNDATPRLHSMIITESLWYLLEFTNNLLRIWKNGSTLLATTYTTTYLEAELPALQFGIVYPNLFIAHKNHPPAMLQYQGSDTFAYVSPIIIVGSSPEYYAGTTTSGSKTIASVTPDPTGSSQTMVGKPISGIGIPAGSIVDSISANSIVISIAATASGSSTYAISQDTTLPFQTSGNYPAAVACANQRVLWFSTTNKPQGAWGSIIGIWDDYSYMQMQFYENVNYTVQKMRTDVNGNPLDSAGNLITAAAGNTPAYYDTVQVEQVIGDADGFEAEIFSDQNDSIQWAVAARDVIIGTLSGEVMMPGDATANDFSFSQIAKVASAAIPGMFISGGIVFVDVSGQRVILMDWQGSSVEMAAYDTLSLFAEHLFNSNPITQIAYESSPIPRLWCLRTDGSVCGLEYDGSYGVRAWWRIVTDGVVKSIVRGKGSAEDTLYLAVLRNGHTIIEAMQTKNWVSQSGVGGLVPAIFLDAAVYKYHATAFTTVAGLGDLEGKTVGMVGDGMYLGTAVVVSGAVTLPHVAPYPVSFNTAIVGLLYDSEVTTMPLEIGDISDSSQALKLTIPHVSITFYKTLDAQIIGVQGGNAESAVLGGAQTTFPVLFSGQEEIPMPSGFSVGSSVTVRSSLPLPCEVNAIVPEVMGYE